MKKIYSLIILSLIYINRGNATPQIWADTINVHNIFLDTLTTVLGQITANFPTAGKVEVHFDGQCDGDTNDMIVLACSDIPDWDVNDGNVGIFTQNIFGTGKSFSHSRVYTVSAGQSNFYAVAQNYVCNGGSGYASVYGMLTVIYFPDTGMNVMDGIGFDTTIAVDAGPTVLKSVTINPQTTGLVLVRFDGSCAMDEGDRVYIGVNNDTNWTGTQSIYLETNSTSVCYGDHTYCTSNAFVVQPGPRTFYALAENRDETDGNGQIYLSGTLTVSFYPSGGPSVIQGATINQTSVVLDNGVVDFASAYANNTTGFVYVHGDGICASDSGDWNVFAVNDSVNWFPDWGSVRTSAYDNDVNESMFSHTMVYQMPLPTNDYHLVGQNVTQTSGSGIADVIGSLVVISFPDIGTGITEQNNNDVSFLIYPNPASGNTTIKLNLQSNEKVKIELFDITGKLIRTIADQSLERGNHKFYWDSSAESGIYFIRVQQNDRILTRKIVVNN